MQRLQHLQHQTIMGGGQKTNANSMRTSVSSSETMTKPSQATSRRTKPKPWGFGSSPIVMMDDSNLDDEGQRTLFVANLDARVTEALLYEVFLQAGPIENVRIPKDKNGRQRAYGFVIYVHRCTTPYAMHLLRGLSLYRKTVTIKFNGKTTPPPLLSPLLGVPQSYGRNNDTFALRGGNYCAYMDHMPSTSRHPNRPSRYGPSPTRAHSNSNPSNQWPQQRRDSPDHNKDKRHYHNTHKRTANNNGGGNNNRFYDSGRVKY